MYDGILTLIPCMDDVREGKKELEAFGILFCVDLTNLKRELLKELNQKVEDMVKPPNPPQEVK